MSGPHLNILLQDEYLLPLVNFLENQRAIRSFFKAGLVCIASYETVVDTDNIHSSIRQIPLRSHTINIYGDTELKEAAIEMINEIISHGEYLLTLGSGFIYNSIISLDCEITQPPSIRGGHANIDKRSIKGHHHLLSIDNTGKIFSKTGKIV